MMSRRGVPPAKARYTLRTNTSVAAAMMVAAGHADAAVSGAAGKFDMQTELTHFADVLGLQRGVTAPTTLDLLVVPGRGPFFFAATRAAAASALPPAEHLAETALMCADGAQRLEVEPVVALLSSSNFGSGMNSGDPRSAEQAAEVRRAVELVKAAAPGLQVDGEMHPETALSQQVRARVFPGSTLEKDASVLVMPNGEAARVAYGLAKELSNAMPVGPMTLGLRRSAHVVDNQTTVRGLLNMTAVAVVDAQDLAERERTGGGGGGIGGEFDFGAVRHSNSKSCPVPDAPLWDLRPPSDAR